MNLTALIAEDEPLLAEALRTELLAAWPELTVVAMVGNGQAALAETLRLKPQVLFFDIRMPGLDGLDAAAELADQWDDAAGALPHLVFVTAHDEYAVQAFERQAVDYLLKPVRPERLAQTVGRIKRLLGAAGRDSAGNDQVLAQLRALLAPPAASAPATPLRIIQASVGSAQGAALRMVPVDEVLYFEAADKYVRVLTAGHEYLIRTPMKDLLPQLDTGVFWQIHRGTVVRAASIDSVVRDESGKLRLSLRGRKEQLAVSRLYAHLFRAM
jgi:DNA-binding LytR/AlgR family response regulator